jgi:hypothetical protein
VPLGQTGCGHSQDARRARPERVPHEWGLRSTSGGSGCDGPGQKTPRNTSTYAVPTAPWPLLDRVEKCSPSGRATRPQAQFEENENRNRRRRVKDDSWKKTDSEEYARSLRLNHGRFGPAATASVYRLSTHAFSHAFSVKSANSCCYLKTHGGGSNRFLDADLNVIRVAAIPNISQFETDNLRKQGTNIRSFSHLL